MNPADTGGPAAEIPSNSWWGIADKAITAVADYRMAQVQASSTAAQRNALPGTTGATNLSAAMTPGAGAVAGIGTSNVLLLALAAVLAVVLVARLAKG